MYVVIKIAEKPEAKIFHNKDNAEQYINNQITKTIREDIDRISYKDGIITYDDGKKVWYKIMEGDVQDE